MAKENKTQPTSASVADFIAAVEPPRRCEDAQTALALYERVTGLEAVMWGPSIVGFGTHNYTYDSGHSGSTPLAAFSPRKANMTFYIGSAFDDAAELFSQLGKHKKSKACVYINKLADVDEAVLVEIIEHGLAYMRETWPTFDS